VSATKDYGYEVWDRESSNLVGFFDTIEQARSCIDRMSLVGWPVDRLEILHSAADGSYRRVPEAAGLAS
jgi:hypothetical protein